MIKTGNGIVSFDTYNYIPGYGENSIEVSIKRDDLTMYIYYDGTKGDEEKIVLHFPGVKFFLKTPFPNKKIIDFDYSNSDRLLGLGGLIEYPNSDLINLLSTHNKNLTHYKIIFFAENLSIDIVSEKYSHST